MAYRGEDLDLRTPQAWSASQTHSEGVAEQGGLNGLSGGLRDGPLWVDEILLACCNHAFDVALAHRAGEVRVEHLLHALTRIDAAAEALEARGVRVAALRRESATIIASEIPVGLPNGKGSPRRSEDFARLLSQTVRLAARHSGPATIDDLIDVLFDQRGTIPELALLSRHAARSYVRDMPDPPRYIAETRYVPAPPDRYFGPAVDAVRYTPEAPRNYRQPLPAETATDDIQNSRIEALEEMVRALSADLSKERKVFSSLLENVSQETQAGRNDQGRLHATLSERLQSIESIVAAGGGGSVDLNEKQLGLIADRLRHTLDLSPLINRLDIIEEAVLSREQGDATAMAGRVEALELEINRALGQSSQTTERIEALVHRIETAGPNGNGVSTEQLTTLTRVLEAQQTALGQLSSKIEERLSTVEEAVTAEIKTAAAKHQAYTNDLSEVHDALMKLNQNQHTLAGSIDQWRADAAKDAAEISNRIAAVDRDTAFPAEKLSIINEHVENLNQLMVERYHRRNRFWFWLFGTDDWLGRSWPSQVHAADAEKRRVQEIAEAEAKEALAEARR